MILKQTSSLCPSQCADTLVFTNGKVLPNSLSSALSEILLSLDLRKSTSNHPTFSACAGLFRVPLPAPTYFFQLVTLVDWGFLYPMGGKKGRSASHPLWNPSSSLYYLTLLMSHLRAYSLKGTGWSLCTFIEMYTLSQLRISSSS